MGFSRSAHACLLCVSDFALDVYIMPPGSQIRLAN
jgi:hypothetical protein